MILGRRARRFVVSVGLVGLCAVGAGGAAAQAPADIGGPAAEHQALATLVGSWRAEVLLHGGGEEPVLAATGLAEARMRLGGRYLEVEISLEPGAPARAVVYLIGFDRRNRRYQIVNLDDSATYLVMAEGARVEGDGWIAATGEDDSLSIPATAAVPALYLHKRWQRLQALQSIPIL